MKENVKTVTLLNTDTGILMLRLIFGSLFVYHGLVKLLSFSATRKYFPDLIGIDAMPSLILVIFAEFICGLFVTLGLFTRLAVISLFVNMTVAFFVAHAQQDFAGKQLPFLVWLLCLVIFVSGSGKFSIDTVIFKKAL